MKKPPLNPDEKRFKRNLVQKLWFVYRHETGRLCTNAFPHEFEKVQALAGVPCEILTDSEPLPHLIRIGPKQ